MFLEIGLGVGVFVGVILALVMIIQFAKDKLVPAGNVKLLINEERELEVPVGGKLLQTLAGCGLYVPSACGGGT
jgi:Na+-transporting NADH:ubiquinone oxidoreductase subunit F